MVAGAISNGGRGLDLINPINCVGLFPLMEFPFNLNAILRHRMTVLHGGGGAGGGRFKSFRRDLHDSEIGEIINEMGVASAKVNN